MRLINKLLFKKFIFNNNDLVVSQDKINKLDSNKLEIIIEILKETNKIDLNEYLSSIPKKQDKIWFNEWPGEHYKLLAGICKVKKPNLVLEIGTWRGLGALALSIYSKLVITYDILSIDSISNSINNLLFKRKNIEQIIGDLSDSDFYSKEIEKIREADIIFIDGPKDYTFEKIMIDKLLSNMKSGSLLVIDDIRFVNMLGIWESIKEPKIDLAEFGHISGTGVVFI